MPKNFANCKGEDATFCRRHAVRCLRKPYRARHRAPVSRAARNAINAADPPNFQGTCGLRHASHKMRTIPIYNFATAVIRRLQLRFAFPVRP